MNIEVIQRSFDELVLSQIGEKNLKNTAWIEIADTSRPRHKTYWVKAYCLDLFIMYKIGHDILVTSVFGGIGGNDVWEWIGSEKGWSWK